MNKISLKPADILILLLAASLTLWLYNIFWFSTASVGEADFLIVQVADNSARRYSLEKDRILKISGTMGESIIEIKQKRARFIHSPCRNQFCVLHGWIEHHGDITACLPNQMSISLYNTQNQDNKLQFDALSGNQ